MRIRLLLLSVFILLPALCWGQSVFVKEKLAQAEDIKSSKGICADFVDVLHGAAELAMEEEDWLSAALIYEDYLDAVEKVFPKEKALISSTKNMIALLYSEADEYEKAIPLLKECYNSSRGQDYEIDAGFLESIISSYVALQNWKEAISYRKQKNELIQKNLGRGLHYADGLFMLSSLYLETHEEKNAIRVLKEALDVLDTCDEKHEVLYNEVKYRYEMIGNSSVLSASAVRRHAIDLVRKGEETHDIMPLCEAMDYLEDKSFVPGIDTLRYSIITSIGHYLIDKGDYNNLIYVISKKPYLKAVDWWVVGDAHENLGNFEYARESYHNAFLDSYKENNDVSEQFFYYFNCYARCCIQTG